jgi:methyltransferase
VSFHHSVKTRQRNDIHHSQISLLRPAEGQAILFPIFDSLKTRDSATTADKAELGGWDVVICNPPFFGSEAEMRDGTEAKAGNVPAVSGITLSGCGMKGDGLANKQGPTAAANELITRGGEVAFVDQMIDESVQLGEACA